MAMLPGIFMCAASGPCLLAREGAHGGALLYACMYVFVCAYMYVCMCVCVRIICVRVCVYLMYQHVWMWECVHIYKVFFLIYIHA
jgi:hypothetical protein